jgi:hypothetical protein
VGEPADAFEFVGEQEASIYGYFHINNRKST